MTEVETLIIGGGQAGLAMSRHLTDRGLAHLVVERGRIAERWRTERWDSLVANGPAWHDRFPPKQFADVEPDGFASRDAMVRYFEQFATEGAAPIRCGVAVTALRAATGGFRAETAAGPIKSRNVVVATGPFQRPSIPKLVPESVPQIHSAAYRNPASLPDGSVLVVGGGSSGAQIADELVAAGRRVFLSVGPHNRPPRRYRGQDYCWWLGVLGKWSAPPPDPQAEHVTIAVSGAGGGKTIDFRRMAARGLVLLGTVQAAVDGALPIAPDLQRNVARGDADHRSVLDEADAYAAREGLDLPDDPAERQMAADPACLTDPILELPLSEIGSIVWATGYGLDLGWIELDAFDEAGRPIHQGGVAAVPGLYFLGLPWLRDRSSSFIWGAWRDAAALADHIGENRT